MEGKNGRKIIKMKKYRWIAIEKVGIAKLITTRLNKN